jgi:hypothetical protein
MSMGIWTLTFGYAALRTLVAGVLDWRAARGGAPIAPVLGQVASDLGCAVVLAACVDYRVREAMGLFALPLAAYVVAWEGWAFLRHLSLANQHDEYESHAEGLGRWLWAFWRVLFVLPAVGSALLLGFTTLYPNSLRLPSERPLMLCTPQDLTARDTLVIEMVTPHGGELLVTNPRSRTLVVVPFAAASVPLERRFEWQGSLRLPVARASARTMSQGKGERIFRDSGDYVFQLNAIPGAGVSLLCRTRLVGAAAAP